jgi:catechol 2,3-dioxygenase-like lactoylglutathione lyase family enzyme
MAETQAQTGQQQVGTEAGGDELAHAATSAPQVTPMPAAAGPQVTPAGPAAPQFTPAGPSASQFTPAGPAVAAAAAAAQSPAPRVPADRPVTGAIHHVELWVPNLDRAIVSWGWLLTSLGYRMFQDWPGGRSWQAGDAYIVVEQSPARTASRHDRCRPGLNHLAFHVATRALVDELTAEALLHGWKLMFADDHPFAGGPQHYAAYLENSDGFEAELVAH